MSRSEADAPAAEPEHLYLVLQDEQVTVGSQAIRRGETLYAIQEVQAATVETYSPRRNTALLLLLVGASLFAAAWIVPVAFVLVLGFERTGAPGLASWAAWLGGSLVVLSIGPLAFSRAKSFVLLETSRGRRVLLETSRPQLADRVAKAVNSAVDGRVRPSTVVHVGRDLTVGRDLNVGGELSSQTSLARDADSRIDGRTAEPAPSRRFPELPSTAIELQVYEERMGGAAALRLGLVALDAAGGTERRWFEPVRLTRDPQPLVDGWWKRLAGPGGAAAHYRELEGLGAEIGAELLARDLTRMLAEQGAGQALWLHSQDPWIPWELLRPPRMGSGESGSRPFLCASFAMTRWQGDREPSLVLPLRRVGVVAPELDAAIAAGAELEMLRGFAGPRRVIVPLQPTIEAVTAALAGGDLDGVHFCGHGARPDQDPSLNAILLRDGELTPRTLAGRLGRFAERRPLVFLNGCHTGRAGFTLTRRGGWAEFFLGAGAGAFIGCSWGVDGDTALHVAECFYRTFLDGATLGGSMRLARLQRGLGDPLSPWAYLAYGHPLARVAAVGGEGTL